MNKRGVRISWLVVLVSATVIAGYLLRHAPTTSVNRPEPSSVPAEPQTGTPEPTLPITDLSRPNPDRPRVSPRAPTPAATGPVVAEPPAASGVEETPVPESPRRRMVQPPRVPPPAPRPDPTAAGRGGARIKFRETTCDFRTMYQDEEVTHEFLFTNVGDVPLTFISISSTCGCTAVIPSKKEFGPGETGSLKVTFYSKRYRDRISKHVYVDTNDAVDPRVVLTFTGVVKVDVEVVPSGVYIGRLKIGDTVSRLVNVRAVEAKDFRILDVKSDHPSLRVGKPELVPEQKTCYRINISFGPHQKLERISAKVTLVTDLKHTKEIVIPVYGRVLPAGLPNAS